MSAFIVNDEIINSIVGFLHYAMIAGNSDHTWKAQPFRENGYRVENRDDCQRLGEDIFKLNCNSIEQRYGEGQAKEFRNLDYKYQHIFPVNNYQVIKNIQCLIYQCSEGDINEESNTLYRLLTRLALELALYIVSRTPQYNACKW